MRMKHEPKVSGTARRLQCRMRVFRSMAISEKRVMGITSETHLLSCIVAAAGEMMLLK